VDPDGRRLVGGIGRRPPNWVWPVGWTADGGSVMAANPGTLVRLDAAPGQIQASVPYKPVADMELSPDGERLVFVRLTSELAP
jgi:hypothetical protein